MAEGLNRVTLIGNLGADPELRTTQGGQNVLNMRLAVGGRYKNKDNEWVDTTEWVNCVMWGKRGGSLAGILSKGSQVCVEGELRTRSYEKDGEKKYATEVVVNNVVLLGSRSRRGEDREDDEDNIPF